MASVSIGAFFLFMSAQDLFKGQPDNKDKSNKYGDLIWASSLGIVVVVSTATGIFAGLWLDKVLGTKPYLTMVFFVLGVIAGFIQIVRAIKRKSEKTGI
jgi:ATP synthase protein I